MQYKKYIYIFSCIIGFLFCWFIFNIKSLSLLYKYIIDLLTYRGILYFILSLFVIILCIFIRNGLLKFLSSKKSIKLVNCLILFSSILLISIMYYTCERYVKNWQLFSIHTLNYMLYLFAWYSLIKAVKVWYRYGNFFQLLLNGKIKKSIINILIVLVILNVICFSQNIVDPLSAVGMLLISVFVLLTICLLFTIIVQNSKTIRKIFEKLNLETIQRIEKHEQPKEVSIAYDQISAIGLSSVVCKRIFDITKNTDLQFIVSKLFKMCCYLVSLSITCKYSKQMQKLKKSLFFFSCLILSLICLSYSSLFHEYLVSHKIISDVVNFIIDHIFLPLGIVKILIQICTIIFAKKTTGVSTVYFTVSAFFMFVTAANLMVKENFYDTTITLSLLKCILYIFVTVVVAVINKIFIK